MNKYIYSSLVALLLLSVFSLNTYAQTENIYHHKLLIIAPHEDDEIITCSGVIRRAVQNGDDIKVIYFSNGDGAHLEKERIKESIAALNLLGVSQDKIVYLGYGDTTLFSLYCDKNSPNAIHQSYFNAKTTSFPDIGLYTYHYLKSGHQGVYDVSNEADYTRNNIIRFY